jgi:hypothetical protein
MKRIRKFCLLVWQPFHGGRITVREAWMLATLLSE